MGPENIYHLVNCPDPGDHCRCKACAGARWVARNKKEIPMKERVYEDPAPGAQRHTTSSSQRNLGSH